MRVCTYVCVCVCICICTCVCVKICVKISVATCRAVCSAICNMNMECTCYGLATITRLLKITGLFCRIAECSLFSRALLRNRPMILRSLLIVATPYVYMCVCINICTCVRKYVCMCVCMYVCMYVCMCAWQPHWVLAVLSALPPALCVCRERVTWFYVRMFPDIRVCMCVCKYICVCACVCAHGCVCVSALPPALCVISVSGTWNESHIWCGAAMISRLLKIIGLFCKRAL